MKNNMKNLFIKSQLTVKDAMKQMDVAAKKILFVIDGRRRLKGAVTDGDIRRWILAEGDLGEKIDRIYNRNPIYAEKDSPRKHLIKKMFDEGVPSIPVVDKNMRVIEILFWKDFVKSNSGKMKPLSKLQVPVVLMAGGQGNRLDPITRVIPKALMPIDDKPVLETIINNFKQYTSGDIYLMLGYKADMIKSYFNNRSFDYDLNYLEEKSKPLGTAGGLKFLPKDITDTFFVSNCDTIIRAKYDDIYNFHKEKEQDITIVSSMKHFTIPYGVLTINSGGVLKNMKEKPEYDFLVNTGMYVIEKKILKFIPKGKLFHITDLIKKVKNQKGRIGVYPISEKSWLDIGQWKTYNETARYLLEDNNGE